MLLNELSSQRIFKSASMKHDKKKKVLERYYLKSERKSKAPNILKLVNYKNVSFIL